MHPAKVLSVWWLQHDGGCFRLQTGLELQNGNLSQSTVGWQEIGERDGEWNAEKVIQILVSVNSINTGMNLSLQKKQNE